jgi:hypothetical protein
LVFFSVNSVIFLFNVVEIFFSRNLTCLILGYPKHSSKRHLGWESKVTIRHAIGVFLKQYPMNSSEMKSYFDNSMFVYEISEESRNFVSEVISKLLKMEF